MKGNAQDITTLVELFRSSGWDEMHVEIDGLQLFLSTDPASRLDTGAAPPRAAEVRVAPPPTQPAPAEPARPAATPAIADVPAHWVAITAPNLGTFYRAPKPGAPPFVEVGQAVEAISDVCLLEVMKLFTTVKAGTIGIIRRVCVDDADMVEHGQALFYIEPN